MFNPGEDTKDMDAALRTCLDHGRTEIVREALEVDYCFFPKGKVRYVEILLMVQRSGSPVEVGN